MVTAQQRNDEHLMVLLLTDVRFHTDAAVVGLIVASGSSTHTHLLFLEHLACLIRPPLAPNRLEYRASRRR